MKKRRRAQLREWSIHVVNRGSLELLFFLLRIKKEIFFYHWCLLNVLNVWLAWLESLQKNNRQSGCCWEQHDVSVKWERVRKNGFAYTSWGSLSAPSPYFSLFLILTVEEQRMRACFQLLRYYLKSTDQKLKLVDSFKERGPSKWEVFCMKSSDGSGSAVVQVSDIFGHNIVQLAIVMLFYTVPL